MRMGRVLNGDLGHLTSFLPEILGNQGWVFRHLDPAETSNSQ